MARRFIFVVVLVVACGETLKIDPTVDGGPAAVIDAGSVETAVVDAGVPEADPNPFDAGAGCDPRAKFGTPRRLDGISTDGNEGGARLTPNERVVYFHRPVTDGYGIFRATRDSRDQAFGLPHELLFGDGAHPSISPDDRRIVFGKKDGLIYFSERPTVAEPFSPARPFFPNVGQSIQRPFVSASGDEIFFDWFTSEGMNVVRAPIDAGSPGIPAEVGAINSKNFDSDPVLSFDGLALYFYSNRNRPGTTQLGSVWMALRDDRKAEFRAPEEVVLPTAGFIAPTWISPDNCRLYLYTDQEYAKYDVDIVVAERPTK